MAFTNVYDDTFPADTELANLIGANLRQVRLDVQQRMAAISGLDASKPNFAGDAQPANWNGILFFATDTGKVYQFNNPVWTDVTLSIGSRILPWLFRDGSVNFVVPSSTTYYIATVTGLAPSIETNCQQPMPLAGAFKGMYVRTLTAQPNDGSLVITLRKNGVAQTITITIPATTAAGIFSDVAHTASFVAGDLISIQTVNNSPTTSSAEIQSINLVY